MSTATQTTVDSKLAAAQSAEDFGVEHCVLDGVQWETYEQLLSELNERHLFLTYDNGTLEIMAPSGRHEQGNAFIGRLLEAYADEMDIPIACFGSVTIKQKKLLKGLEPDCCYYVKNEPRVAHNTDLDFAVDPPPDLAIEMEVSRRISNRQGIYAALGIAEVWLDDGRHLRVLHLQPSGKYKQKDVSLNFPDLPVAEFEKFLRMRPVKSEHEVVKAFRSWLRKKR